MTYNFSISDYKFGKKCEKELKPKLETLFGGLNGSKKMDRYDFYNDKYHIEIKSRNCKHNKYPDTLLPVDKVLDVDKEQYFIFNFTDTVMYIKYDKTVFDTFNIKLYHRSNNYVLKMYYYIPIDKLTELK